MHFWCLLIKVNDFAFDEDAVLWPETTCLDGWVVLGGWVGVRVDGWLDFLKIQPSQPPTKAGVGAGAELGNLLQETSYLGRCTAGVPENIAISAQTKAGVRPNIFLVPTYHNKQLCL